VVLTRGKKTDQDQAILNGHPSEKRLHAIALGEGKSLEEKARANFQAKERLSITKR